MKTFFRRFNFQAVRRTMGFELLTFRFHRRVTDER